MRAFDFTPTSERTEVHAGARATPEQQHKGTIDNNRMGDIVVYNLVEFLLKSRYVVYFMCFLCKVEDCWAISIIVGMTPKSSTTIVHDG